MNVTFHVLTGITAATFLSPPKTKPKKMSLLAGFAVSVALHGLLDYLPHSYPIKPVVDVPLAIVVFCIASILAKREIRPLLAACFLGSIFPDLVDLAPGILDRHFDFNIPRVEYFPWHWKQYSGSIYDGSRAVESLALHLIVVAAVTFSIWRRRDLFRTSPREIADR